MPQCASCKTHNEESAAFCSQCGTPLGGGSFRRRRHRFLPRFRIPLFTGGLILAALLMVLWIVWSHPEKPTITHSGRHGRDSSKRALTPEDPTGGSGGERAKVFRPPTREPPEPKPLDADGASQLVAPALVILELRKEDDSPLREGRGILVDSSGVVLCRVSSLLGAYRGTCRLPYRGPQRAEILGISYSIAGLDVALIRLERSRAGYPVAPLLRESPAEVLDVGENAFVFNNYRPERAEVGETHVVGTDGVARVLLAEIPSVSPASFLAVDAFGLVIGLCKVEVGGRSLERGDPLPSADYRILVDPAFALVPGIGRQVSMTLAQLSRRLYEGTFRDHFARGMLAYQAKRWDEAITHFEQAFDRIPTDQPPERDVTQLTGSLRESYLEEIRRLAGDNRMEEAAFVAERALVLYAEDPVFLVLLGEVRFDQGAWMEGIVALAQAYELEPSERVESLLERGYLELVQEAVALGDVQAQETSFLQGIQQLPDSGILRLELAKLYIQFQAYDDAIRLLRQARELDSSLGDSVENLLAKIDDAIKRRNAVIVPIPTGSRSIRTEAVIDGHTASSFIIDTGATYTSIPAVLANTLGYDTSPSNARRITISGVGGRFNVPLIRVQSLDLGGYTVRNLDVIVLPEKIGPNVGLLGLNFLKHFKYSVDSKRQEFRLERL